jgi:hypothetical protein
MGNWLGLMHVTDAVSNDDVLEPTTAKVTYGVVAEHEEGVTIYLTFVNTVQEAKELLRRLCGGLGDGSSEYWVQRDYGQHGETFSIIENPDKLIKEFNNCHDCTPNMEDSTASELHYYIEDCVECGEAWDRYILKFMYM